MCKTLLGETYIKDKGEGERAKGEAAFRKSPELGRNDLALCSSLAHSGAGSSWGDHDLSIIDLWI